mmetsp:Transcript_26681/g.58485  ORF Transcript_26681/g.58485 Transcript_26681/m.58485 type:complete len:88 (-) Transcript_26681:90-353(-)
MAARINVILLVDKLIMVGKYAVLIISLCVPGFGLHSTVSFVFGLGSFRSKVLVLCNSCLDCQRSAKNRKPNEINHQEPNRKGNNDER